MRLVGTSRLTGRGELGRQMTQCQMAGGGYHDDGGMSDAATNGFVVAVVLLTAIVCMFLGWFIWKCFNIIARAFYQHPRNRALWCCVVIWISSIVLVVGTGVLTGLGSPDSAGDLGQTLILFTAGGSASMFLVLALVARIVLVRGDDTLRVEQALDIHNILTDWWTPLGTP